MEFPHYYYYTSYFSSCEHQTSDAVMVRCLCHVCIRFFWILVVQFGCFRIFPTLCTDWNLYHISQSLPVHFWYGLLAVSQEMLLLHLQESAVGMCQTNIHMNARIQCIESQIYIIYTHTMIDAIFIYTK